MSKKIVGCAMALMILITFAFSACGKKSDDSSQASGSGELGLRITWKEYSGRGEAIQRIVDVYNRESAVKIAVVGGDEDVDAIENMIQTKDSNTIYVLPYRLAQYMGDKGYLRDLTAYFQEEAVLFYPELWRLGQVGGKDFGIPWMGHSICLIYNKNILSDAGVDPTSIIDLASFVRALEAVEAKTDAYGIGLVGANHNDVSWMVNQFVYGFGSLLVDETGTKVMVNNPRASEALHFYKDVLGKHAQPTWVNDTGVEVMDYFRRQQVAFEMQGIWGVTDIKKNGNLFPVGIISLEDIGLYAEVGPMMLTLPATMSDENVEDAVDFIRFLISAPAQEQLMNGEYSPEHDTYYPFRTPVRKDLSDSLIFNKYPEYDPFLEGFRRPSVDVPVPKWQVIKEELYAPGLHQVMAGEKSVEEFLKEIEGKGNEILNR
jgi:ABC-type glycerol-3-phosphate transport system substrate-binding protein